MVSEKTRKVGFMFREEKRKEEPSLHQERAEKDIREKAWVKYQCWYKNNITRWMLVTAFLTFIAMTFVAEFNSELFAIFGAFPLATTIILGTVRLVAFEEDWALDKQRQFLSEGASDSSKLATLLMEERKQYGI